MCRLRGLVATAFISGSELRRAFNADRAAVFRRLRASLFTARFRSGEILKVHHGLELHGELDRRRIGGEESGQRSQQQGGVEEDLFYRICDLILTITFSWKSGVKCGDVAGAHADCSNETEHRAATGSFL